jgi:hypothetical protein
MEHPYPAVEFEAVVTPDGMIAVPAAMLKNLPSGVPVTVRITEGTVSNSLRAWGVTEELVEGVAELQLERREHVVAFLEAEGTLAADKKFATRAGSKRRVRPTSPRRSR